MRDNTGDMPLPRKVRGEGGLDSAYYGKKTEGGRGGTGRNGSSPAPSGDTKDPMGNWRDGTTGKGKEAAPVPKNQGQ